MLVWFIATALAAPSDWGTQETGALGMACDSSLESIGMSDQTARLALCACTAGEVMEATDPATFQTNPMILQDSMVSCIPRIREVLPDSDFTPLVRSMWSTQQITVIRGLCPGFTNAEADSQTCACFADHITGDKTLTELQALSEGDLEAVALSAVNSCGGSTAAAAPAPAPPSTPEPEPEPEPEPFDPSDSSSGFHPGLYAAWDKGLGATDRDRAFTLGLELPIPGPRAWLQWQREDIFGSRVHKVELMWDVPVFARQGFAIEGNLGAGYAFGDEKGLGLLVGAEAEYWVALSDNLSFIPFVRVTRPLFYSVDGSALREPMLHIGLEVQL